MSEVSTKKRKSRFSKERKKDILKDYLLGWLSRHVSILGRKEVLSGKAKFGIFGDGKELPQLAMAKVFKMVISEVDITVIKPLCLQLEKRH